MVKGKVYEMPPAGARHGNVAMQIGILLGGFVRANNLGRTFAAETGFILRRGPDTVRAPDASFVARDRLTSGELPTGFLEMAPDLAVEVVSPDDSRREIREKSESWIQAGTRLVWVIDPASRSATVYSSNGDVREVEEDGILDGEDSVPGFACSPSELFA